MKSNIFQVAVISLSLTAISLQSAAADCFQAYTNKVNQIENEQIPDAHKRPKIYQMVFAHAGATLVGAGVGAVAGFIVSFAGCLVEDQPAYCGPLFYAFIGGGAVVGNIATYEGFDKPDSSTQNAALASQKDELSEYQTPYLAINELRVNAPGVNVKNIMDKVSALTPSAQGMTEQTFVKIFSTMNEDNDFCQNGSPSDQNDMVLKIKNEVEASELSH